MPRPKTLTEQMLLRLMPGTTARVREIIGDGDMAAFVRAAIDEKIARERAKLGTK